VGIGIVAMSIAAVRVVCKRAQMGGQPAHNELACSTATGHGTLTAVLQPFSNRQELDTGEGNEPVPA
jgi:hypothetical protein